MTMVLLVAFLVAAAPGPSQAGARRVPEGRWGGTGIAVDVTASGARLDFDCAHGTIDAPLTLDAEGRFDAPGTFVQERPGPVRMGEEEQAEPARYTGSLEGDTLTVRVLRKNPRGAIPNYSAVLGRSPRVRKCG